MYRKKFLVLLNILSNTEYSLGFCIKLKLKNENIKKCH